MTPLPTFAELRAKHFDGLWDTLAEELRADVEATFKSLAELTADSLRGQDVEIRLLRVRATIKHWQAGALAMVASRFEAAFSEWLEALGKALAAIAKGAFKGLTL